MTMHETMVEEQTVNDDINQDVVDGMATAPTFEPKQRWKHVCSTGRVHYCYAKDEASAIALFEKHGLPPGTIEPFGGIDVRPDGRHEYRWPDGHEPKVVADHAPAREARK